MIDLFLKGVNENELCATLSRNIKTVGKLVKDRKEIDQRERREGIDLSAQAEACPSVS